MATIEPAARPTARSSADPDHERPTIRALGATDLPGALKLTRAASWNQNEADWRMMLELGRGWGIDTNGDDARSSLVASIVVLPYGDAFAWISMVLVAPEFRGRGYAQRLLRHALGALARRGMGGVLDATPAGHPVYRQEGFVDSWRFRRFLRDAAPTSADRAAPTNTRQANATRAGDDSAPSNAAVRALQKRDWPQISMLDRSAFGGDRSALLRRLAARLPRAAHVAEREGRLAGFVLGRDGHEAQQIGPLVCDDPVLVPALLDAALSSIEGPIYLDAADHHGPLLDALAERGFAEQRPFTRMLHALDRAPGDERRVFLVAGPELG
ncbi:MAG: GNAT family N-acetyltransferase [Burkholderiaceae bacterium]|nr:GNAT family N-acetyltransferase [Burkholderiaceae bacterium]